MKLLIERSHLHAALSIARGALDNSHPIPMARHLRLTALGAALLIDATDFDLMLSTSVPAEIDREGSIAVPAAALWDLVRFAPEGAEIAMDLQGDKLAFRAGKALAHLVTLPAGDFPDIAQGSRNDPATRWTMSAEALARMLGETDFAMSANETDWTLYGTHFHRDDIADRMGRLVTVTSNRQDLARSDIALPSGAEKLPPLTIPRKAMLVIAGLLAKMKGDIEIAADDNSITVTVGPTLLSSKLIDAPFPDYRRIIPSEAVTTVIVERGALADLVSRVGAFAAERKSDKVTWYYIELEFDPAEGAPKLRALSTSQLGSISDEIDATIEGDKLSIAVDPKRLAVALKAITGPDVKIRTMGRGKPLTLTDSSRDDFLALVTTKNVLTQMDRAEMP